MYELVRLRGKIYFTKYILCNANDGDDSEDDDDVLVELVLDQSLSQVIFTFLVEIQ